MRVLGITLAGRMPTRKMPPSRFANVTRKVGSPWIEVELISPSGDRTYHARANRASDVISMAERIQEFLDGGKGTNSMVQDYYRMLQHLTD
ncbi:MAG TPA: hypothetical protein P5279_12625 [Anaerohalosphaeraceae bacterium]|jgi:hypothetical protein|nr:hypothetical protein [Anaerohalosphaeraceae bacterium]